MAGDPYERFLGSHDMASWSRCLGDYEDAISRARAAPDGGTLAKAARVAMYVHWLSILSGNEAEQERSRKSIDEFARALQLLHRRSPSPATATGLATLVAWRGYTRSAEAMLDRLGAITPDIALLIVPSGHARRAAFLLKVMHEHAALRFAPVRYFYLDALIHLGRLEEVRAALADVEARDDDGMTRDLRGRVHEQSGEWSDAYEVYTRRREGEIASDWPIHSYRAALCRIVSGQVVDAESPGLVIDAAAERQLTRFDAEIDQLELARMSSFINACRWNTFENWAVHFELGKLAFRRRRHLRADACLRLAAEQCPERVRFSVEAARFVNLTWLTGKSLSRELSMRPEAYECGTTSIAAAADGHAGDDDGIRVWLASGRADANLLAPVLAGKDGYTKGAAHAILGDTPASLRSWLQAVEESYQPRAIVELIQRFVASEFTETAASLVDLMLEESRDDFFVLWELALELRRSLERRPNDRLEERAAAIEVLLEELGRFNFQHLLRAYELFMLGKREDRARAALRRAGTLAESPEENLQVAVARRRLAGFRPGGEDDLGLICLRRAARESSDRLERLEIARECGHYGQVLEMRRLLEEERVLQPETRLEPAEYAAVVQCGQWLAADELNDLIPRAIRGIFDGDAEWSMRVRLMMLDRLADAVEIVDPERAARIRDARARAEGREATNAAAAPAASVNEASDDDDWDAWRRALESDADLEHRLADRGFHTRLVAYAERGGSEVQVALWSVIARRLQDKLTEASSTRPPIDPARTPFSRSGTMVDDWRAQEVSDLWRGYLASRDEADQRQTLERIKAFYADEATLVTAWEEARRTHASKPRQRALALAEVARPILALLQRQPPADTISPATARICAGMARDAALLLGLTSQRIARLSGGVSKPHDGSSHADEAAV